MPENEGRWRCTNEEECDFEGPKDNFDFGQFGGIARSWRLHKVRQQPDRASPPGEENYYNFDEKGIEKSS